MSCTLGSKPCMVFAGDLFETDSEYMRLKNLLIGTTKHSPLPSLPLPIPSPPCSLSMSFPPPSSLPLFSFSANPPPPPPPPPPSSTYSTPSVQVAVLLVAFLCFPDFLRGSNAAKIRLAGLDHVMCYTAVEGKIHLRTYQYVDTPKCDEILFDLRMHL